MNYLIQINKMILRHLAADIYRHEICIAFLIMNCNDFHKLSLKVSYEIYWLQSPNNVYSAVKKSEWN